MNRKGRILRLVTAVGILLMASCATNKDAFPNKFHHAVNTRFNVFFNGSESFKEGAQALSKTTMDNYTQVLPVYVYPSKVEAQAQSPKWDRAIEKCSKAVSPGMSSYE